MGLEKIASFPPLNRLKNSELFLSKEALGLRKIQSSHHNI